MWDYQEHYEKLLETLARDNRPWRAVFNIPKDGTKIYFKCGIGYKGDTLYDVGAWQDYTKSNWYCEGDLEGEFCTSFGNCMEIVAWKLVKQGD